MRNVATLHVKCCIGSPKCCFVFGRTKRGLRELVTRHTSLRNDYTKAVLDHPFRFDQIKERLDLSN